MKPTKEDREAAQQDIEAAIAWFRSHDYPWPDSEVLGLAKIIAEKMAPEREQHEKMTASRDAALLNMGRLNKQLEAERKRARRLDKALTDLHEWASNKAAEHDGPRENCCDFCWSILAAAEALDKSEVEDE